MTQATKRSTIAWADCSTVLIFVGLPMNTAASTPNERVKIKKAFEMVIGLVPAYDLRCLVDNFAHR